MSDSQSDYDEPSQKPKSYLEGTMTKLTANANFTNIIIHLKERLVKEEEEEHIPSQSTSNKPTNRQNHQKNGNTNRHHQEGEHHLIKLNGPWCRLLTQDLKETLTMKIYLNCYNPELDLRKNCWDFHEGLRADLCIQTPVQNNQVRQMFLKKIDLGPASLTDFYEVKASESDEEVVNDLMSDGQTTPLKTSWQQKHLNSGQSSTKQKIKREGSPKETEGFSRGNSDSQQSLNPHKRICTDLDVDASLLVDFSDPTSMTQDPITSTDLSTTSGLDLTCAPASNLPSTCIDPHGQPTQSEANTIHSPKEAPKPKFTGWKTLNEIDKMSGGYGQRFNIIAIIKSQKTPECVKLTGVTSDYQMTMYLSDCSKPQGCDFKGTTCNLFWKSELESPSWLKASWQIIMLFGVIKRRSDLYPTQIIGPAGAFQWALWSSAYPGSAEALESSSLKNPKKSLVHSNSILLNEFELTEEDMKKSARELHETYQARSSSDPQSESLVDSDSFHPTAFSIPKVISELSPSLRHRFDLCVQIIDIWSDSPGNDRITVTDYTPNSLFKAPIPSFLTNMSSGTLFGNLTPSVQLHLDHGGNVNNWGLTASRLMTIYTGQPILQVIYQKLQNHDKSNQASVHELKAAFVGKYFKINEVDVRARAGSSKTSVIYGLIESPVHSTSDSEISVGDLGDETFDLLASKIVPLLPSDPSYRKLLRAEESYRLELQNST